MKSRGAIVNLFIGCLIAFLPLFVRVCNYDVGRMVKDNLLTLFFISMCFLLPSEKRKVNKYGIILFVYCLITACFNHWEISSSNVILQSFHIVAALSFFFAYYERHDKKTFYYLLNGMVFGAAIQSISSILYVFQIDPYAYVVTSLTGATKLNPFVGNPPGTLGNSNLASAYLCITLLAFFRKKLVWLVVPPITALILSKSLMGIFASIGGVLFYLNLRMGLIRSLYVYLISVASMVALFFTGGFGLDSGRFSMWYKCVSIDVWSFLFGHGSGWFPDQKLVVLQEAEEQVIFMQEHNEFISFFNVFGIIGIILLILFILKSSSKNNINPIYSSILFAGFLNCFGHFTFHQSTCAVILIPVAAFCLSNKEG